MKWTIPNILTVLRLFAAPAVILAFIAFPTPASLWVALALFVGAALTDWVDGYLARAWGQESRFGAMLDPIADKAMVIIALVVVLGVSGLSPWLVIPGTVILFREVFISGLREFLGAEAGLLKVTKLAKWKTTAQMVAITLLLLALGLVEENNWTYRAMTPEVYLGLLESGAEDFNSVWLIARAGQGIWIIGVCLFWVSALLTAVTGWDYFSKAMPFLREER